VTAPPAIIEARGLEVRYHGGPEPAVRGVDLALAPGEGLLVSGSAGSGKTSLLRGLLGMVAHRGEALVLGRPVGAPQTRGQVGYGPQGERFASELRVREAVVAAAALRRAATGSSTQIADDALARAGLAFVAGWRTGRLDAEGWRRLSLALAIAGDPPLLVLDDPWTFADSLREIASARARGGAVLATTQRPAGLAPALGRRIVLADGALR
jgi:zinc transport system ATP-binding protein